MFSSSDEGGGQAAVLFSSLRAVKACRRVRKPSTARSDQATQDRPDLPNFCRTSGSRLIPTPTANTVAGRIAGLRFVNSIAAATSLPLVQALADVTKRHRIAVARTTWPHPAKAVRHWQAGRRCRAAAATIGSALLRSLLVILLRWLRAIEKLPRIMSVAPTAGRRLRAS